MTFYSGSYWLRARESKLSSGACQIFLLQDTATTLLWTADDAKDPQTQGEAWGERGYRNSLRPLTEASPGRQAEEPAGEGGQG